MILIFVLCLKLSILHLCASNLGYQCTEDDSSNNPEIFLIKDDEISHYLGLDSFYQYLFNDEFITLCSNYYNITISSPKDAEKHDLFIEDGYRLYNITPRSKGAEQQRKMDLNWQAIRCDRKGQGLNYNINVIHFAAPDYYDGKPLKNFVYAGNISRIDETVCTKINKDEPDEPVNYDCNEIVNLVSEPVLKIHDGHVYNFVQQMHMQNIPEAHEYLKIRHKGSCTPFFQNTLDLNVVLLCLAEPYFVKKVNIQPLKLIQVRDDNCDYYLNRVTLPWDSTWNRNHLLAVLAPAPFKLPTESSVPTIFYKSPYLFSEDKTAFPNSMSLVPWRLLKYGFLKFIQTVGWQRVAIVTDDSEYSLDFEDELTALFSKERMMYTVIRCEDANCEMDKIAQELSRVSAKIVIANVEEKHAQYLVQNAHHKITWLVRDMVGDRPFQELASDQNAFSISLRLDVYTKGCYVEDRILTGLSSIAQAHKNVAKEEHKERKHEFYRGFSDNVNHYVTPRITDATVVVRRLYGSEEFSTMSVNATGAKVISFTNPFKSGKPNDGTAHCLVTSYDYHNPCEDPLVVILMLILMLFLLTFITITCYFDRTSPVNDIRYRQF